MININEGSSGRDEDSLEFVTYISVTIPEREGIEYLIYKIYPNNRYGWEESSASYMDRDRRRFQHLREIDIPKDTKITDIDWEIYQHFSKYGDSVQVIHRKKQDESKEEGNQELRYDLQATGFICTSGVKRVFTQFNPLDEVSLQNRSSCVIL